MHADVIVVGGGIAGLTAAATAARAGAEVVVLESTAEPGGRAATETRPGFRFNLGPHALYRGAEGMPVLRRLGIAPRGGVPAGDGALASWGGELHAMPAGPFSLLTTTLLPAAAKIDLARAFAGLRTADAAALRGRTVSAWLDELAHHERSRALLHALVRLATYCNAPEILDAGVAALQVQRGLAKNVLYLHGGWEQLVSALRAAAPMTLRRHAQVVEVNSDLTVRLAGGEALRARGVVLAVPPGRAAALLSGRAEGLEGLTPVRAACLTLGLEKLPRARPTFVLGIDRPTYMSVHTATAELADAGGAVVHLAIYLPPGEAPDARASRQELEGIMDQAHPGWRAVERERAFYPSLVVSHALPRPGVARPAVARGDGVFLAGDWVGGEGLLADAALASGERAGGLAARAAMGIPAGAAA